jgi:hypothetical protein
MCIPLVFPYLITFSFFQLLYPKLPLSLIQICRGFKVFYFTKTAQLATPKKVLRQLSFSQDPPPNYCCI